MYFKSRHQAGEKMATELAAYRYENTAVLALSEGGVLVGEPIARALHTSLQLLLTEPIKIPDLGNEVLGLIDQSGAFTYNQMISTGQLEAILADARNTIEETKMHKFYELSRLLGDQGLVDLRVFYGRNVIMVSDGLLTGLSLAAAVNFLKPIRTAKLIGAAPMASVSAVDQLHILCDEIHVLNVITGDFEPAHYYEDNVIGDTGAIMERLNRVILGWA